MKYPMQPIYEDENGIKRFQENAIVRWMLDNGSIDMNKIDAEGVRSGRFSQDDQEQFAQLIGYSVCGFGDLSYVGDEAIRKADEMASPEIHLHESAVQGYVAAGDAYNDLVGRMMNDQDVPDEAAQAEIIAAFVGSIGALKQHLATRPDAPNVWLTEKDALKLCHMIQTIHLLVQNDLCSGETVVETLAELYGGDWCSSGGCCWHATFELTDSDLMLCYHAEHSDLVIGSKKLAAANPAIPDGDELAPVCHTACTLWSVSFGEQTIPSPWMGGVSQKIDGVEHLR